MVRIMKSASPCVLFRLTFRPWWTPPHPVSTPRPMSVCVAPTQLQPVRKHGRPMALRTLDRRRSYLLEKSYGKFGERLPLHSGSFDTPAYLSFL
ncbi:hypothetical protein J6590_018099 [Homalodisca vitripennis]|nr:hypothetical protein J6590_018099 [Homalodisca vitripennis]